MPELPEVETVRRTLKNKVINRKILSCTSYWDKIIVGDVDRFKLRIMNQTVHDVLRVGKYLIFELDDFMLLSHLRMEGKYFYCHKKDERRKHSHICFELDNDYELRYDDVRKFGKLTLLSKEDYLVVPPLSKLGKEPFEIETDELYEKFSKVSLPIKSALLDQSIMAGLGNIYANEVCFKARINPYKKAKELTKEEIESVILCSRDILNHSIELGGTTIHSFSNDGIDGLFQQVLLVHGLVNKPCSVCGQVIKKTKIATRGTYYCSKCQEVDDI